MPEKKHSFTRTEIKAGLMVLVSAAVLVIFQLIPVQFTAGVPFAALSKFIPHEIELLAGVSHLISK